VGQAATALAVAAEPFVLSFGHTAGPKCSRIEAPVSPVNMDEIPEANNLSASKQSNDVWNQEVHKKTDRIAPDGTGDSPF